MELEHKNISTLKSVIDSMKPYFRPDTILLVVANPVDTLTSIALEFSGLPRSQVIGSGTFLDSVRLRGLLADKAAVRSHPQFLPHSPANRFHRQVNANSIDVFVLGVQGESQFVAWSAATFGGAPLDKALPLTPADRARLADECKAVSRAIIQEKGAISFGIGATVSNICASIFADDREVRPVSHFQPELGCCLSLPAVLGRKGALRTVPLELSEEEQATLTATAKELKANIDRLTPEES